MSNPKATSERTTCSRKEPRFKASNNGTLRCETTLANCGLRHGTVLDLSSSGVRLLCEGDFEVGQSIFTELTTSRSHGIYRGEIRRVEPWTNGQSVLGCSLEEKIPAEVLENLAHEGAVNRRSDERVDLEGRPAKLSWQLKQGEVDAELHDLSEGGMKIASPEVFPADHRLRFRIETDQGEALFIEALPVWQQEHDDGSCTAGVAFTGRGDSIRLASKLGLAPTAIHVPQDAGKEHISQRVRGILCVAGAALAAYLLI